MRLMASLRARTESGAAARIRAYYHVIPDRESRLALDRADDRAERMRERDAHIVRAVADGSR